jgi:hypothetical protein
MGISAVDFWLMEIYELNQALQEYEEEKRERLMMWRLSNYIMAAPHFDPKKPMPTVEQWHPFPWDQETKSKRDFIPYDEQIEFTMKVGKPEWIPNHWYLNSEKYKHLAKSAQDGKTRTHARNSRTKRAPKSAEASPRKDQAK